MKKYKQYFLLISMMGMFLMVGTFNGTNTVQAEHMTEFPTMECDTPTASFAVQSVQGELKFNITELKVPKNTCIKMTFFNPSDVEHDFTIEYNDEEWIHMDAIFADDDEGLNSTSGTYYFGYPENKTTMEEQGKGVATHFYMTPNEDITLTAFCEVEGHQDAGMEFDFVVGDGSPAASPGFELPIFLFSIFIVGVVSTLYRKSKK